MKTTDSAANEIKERDFKLVARIQEGDEAALSELYTLYADIITTKAALKGLSMEIARSVTNAMFTALWENRFASFSPENGSVIAWLSTIIARRAIDEFRKLSAYTRAMDRYHEGCESGFLPPPLSEVGETAREIEISELHRAIQNAIGTLPPSQAKAIEAVFLQGMTQRQAAAFLNIPLGTLKTQVELGVKKLRVARDIKKLSNEPIPTPMELEKTKIAERLREVMSMFSDGRGRQESPYAFGIRVDLSYGVITAILTGKTVTEKSLLQICQRTGIRFEWLAYGNGPKWRNDNQQITPNAQVTPISVKPHAIADHPQRLGPNGYRPEGGEPAPKAEPKPATTEDHQKLGLPVASIGAGMPDQLSATAPREKRKYTKRTNVDSAAPLTPGQILIRKHELAKVALDSAKQAYEDAKSEFQRTGAELRSHLESMLAELPS